MKDIEKLKEKWEEKKKILEVKKEIKEEKEKLKGKKVPSTTKILIAFLFLNCTITEIFTYWSIIKSFSLAENFGFSIDFSPLLALIGAIVGEVIGYAIYSLKSAKENTKGGIVYDTAMYNMQKEYNDDESLG